MAARSGPLNRSSGKRGPAGASIQVFFDPELSNVELLDALAERQADAFPDESRHKPNSNQLRKYFGEIKDLYRQFEAMSATADPTECYRQKIEPRFKMIRSKVAYGRRAGSQGKLSKEFADLISQGIEKVRPGNDADFVKFVMHLEAVVGFMYGKDKISK